jgi:hypothetical protein
LDAIQNLWAALKDFVAAHFDGKAGDFFHVVQAANRLRDRFCLGGHADVIATADLTQPIKAKLDRYVITSLAETAIARVDLPQPIKAKLGRLYRYVSDVFWVHQAADKVRTPSGWEDFHDNFDDTARIVGRYISDKPKTRKRRAHKTEKVFAALDTDRTLLLTAARPMQR